ncbi:hypothetical protein AVEN_222012-1, partial [Araneus ventricosus]
MVWSSVTSTPMMEYTSCRRVWTEAGVWRMWGDHQLTQGCGSATEPSQSESIYPLVDLSEERNEHKEDPPSTFEADSSSNE